MYAIVEIAGQQFKVEKDQQIFVHRLEGNKGDKVSFDQVLLIDNDGKIAVGAPAVADAAVTGQIIEHLRGDKVIVLKKKRRKGYKKRNGHRQDLTKIQIESILEKGGSKTVKAAKAAPKSEAKTATPKADAKKATPAKKAAPKAAATKKAEPKKAEAKASGTATKKAPAKSAASKTAKTTAPKAASAAKTKSAPAKKAAPKKDDKK